jgi:hypothetical protein
MPQPNTPLEMLKAFRDILVERRTQVLRAVFEARAKSEGETTPLMPAHDWEKGRDIAEVQGLIAAVDEAIAQEGGV